MIIKYKKNKFNVKLCRTFASHARGLMFRFPKEDGLLFVFKKEKPVSLHTFFVFFPIDVVYINKNKKVIKIIKKVLPFTLYLRPIKCKYILELKDSKNIKEKTVLDSL